MILFKNVTLRKVEDFGGLNGNICKTTKNCLILKFNRHGNWKVIRNRLCIFFIISIS